MSHFTMLVAGHDVDYQLAPFHEFESTGYDDEFVESIDVSKEMRERYEEAKTEYASACEKHKRGELTDAEFKEKTQYKFKGNSFEDFLRDYEEIRIAETEQEVVIGSGDRFLYNYALRIGDDNFKVINRTNPNAKWDWYVEGGRWNNLLLLKEKNPDGTDKFSNSATKSEIDFEEMWLRKNERLRTKYKKVIALLGHVPSIEYTWEDLTKKCRGKNAEMTWDEAREKFHSQKDQQFFDETFKKEENRNIIGFGECADDYACTEDEYVDKHSPFALTFGFVIDRLWNEKAEMGWWGCTSNEKDPKSWNLTYKEFIDSLDDDTLLTVVDCHI